MSKRSRAVAEVGVLLRRPNIPRTMTREHTSYVLITRAPKS